MTIENVQLLCFPNSNPKELKVAARDAKTGEILGQVVARAEEEKIYSGKIPQGYINSKTSGKYIKRAKPHMYVEDLFVKEEARHEGIGKKLIGKVVESSTNRGYNGRVMLFAGNGVEVSPLPFYGKLGFLSGDKYINSQIRNSIDFGTPMNKNIQSFMAITEKGIQRLLKAIR